MSSQECNTAKDSMKFLFTISISRRLEFYHLIEINFLVEYTWLHAARMEFTFVSSFTSEILYIVGSDLES